MITRMRPLLTIAAALLGALTILGSAQAKHLGLNGKEDFAEIARQGFFEVINNGGTFTSDPLNLATPDDPIPYQQNSYTWMSAWFNGKYYVGTVRSVDCFLVDPNGPFCPAGGFPGANQRGEIWAYTPNLASPGGIRGTWARVLQSPFICDTFPVPALCGFVPGFPDLPELPRDYGYRGAVVGPVGALPLDPTSRLWIGAFGTGGRILWTTNGTTFNVASTNGLSTITTLGDLAPGGIGIEGVDFGYRAILFWNGRLWIAPAGSALDEDAPVNPVVLANSNPANTGSTWATMVNLETHPTLGDPNNLGVFTMAVFNGDLYIGVGNRTTGFQVWKAASASCPAPPGVCNSGTIVWTKIIDKGGGRQITGENGLLDSTGVAAMEVHDPDGPGGVDPALYLGVSEAAAFDTATAELFRINADGTSDLIMGRPRLKSLMDGDPAFANFNCSTPNVPGGLNFNFDSGDSFTGDAAIGIQAACFPRSNMGAGFGAGASTSSPFTGGFGTGGQNYIWRLESHDDGSGTGPFLYAGTLDISADIGADLRRSKDGVTWNTANNFVNTDGLGNRSNYGIRTLVSVPDWPNSGPGGSGTGPALLVGTANPFTGNSLPTFLTANGASDAQIALLLGPTPATGGCEVHVGTCAPPAVLVADARVTLDPSPPNVTIAPEQFDGIRYVAFDDENCVTPAVSCLAGNKSVTVALNGSNSANLFCGDNPDSGLSAPGAPTVVLAGLGAGNVDIGTHTYKITFVTGSEETQGGATSTVVTVIDNVTNGQVALTAIPIGSASVTARKIYRTVLGNTGPHKLVFTIPNNVDTTYTDNTLDSGLGAAVPTTNGTSDYQWYIGTVADCTIPTNLPVTTGTPATGSAATVTGLKLCTDATCLDGSLIAAAPDIGTGFADHRFTLRVTSPDPTTPTPVCDEVIVRASADLLPTATITTTPPLNVEFGIPILFAVDLNPPGPTASFGITGVCAPSLSSVAIASCAWSFVAPVTLNDADSTPSTPNTGTIPVTPLEAPVARTISLTATDAHGYKRTTSITAVGFPEVHDGVVEDIQGYTDPGTVFVPQTVTVEVRNDGTVSQPMVVTLVDPDGGVVSPPSRTVTPGVTFGLDDFDTNVDFTWTPTSASPHNLTASVAPVAGETDLADNQLVEVVQVNAAPPLVAAVLPLSRSATVGTAATAFGVMINTGPDLATACSIAAGTPAVAATFSYQTTDAGNALTGTANTPIDIPAGLSQNFVFAFTPTAAFAPTEIQLNFDCTNTLPAPSISGVNRFLLSASAVVTPVPDIVALVGTCADSLVCPGFVPGTVDIPGPSGTGAFGVATVNVGGAGADITASADTGTVILPVTITICETTGAPGGACLTGPTPPITTSVTTNITALETNTFAVFVTGTGTIPFLPGTNRVFVRFKEGAVTRGSTSVAVRTFP